MCYNINKKSNYLIFQKNERVIHIKKALIIGAGPAGISASLYLARSNKADVTVVFSGKSALEKAEKIENYFGFAQPVSGKELLENGIAGAKRLGVKFVEEEIIGLQLSPDFKYETITPHGSETYDTVLIATGANRTTPKIKGIKEFEGRGISYCAVCDSFFYKGKPVAVIGSGEYALHEAMTLINTASSVTILTNGEEMKTAVPDNIPIIKDKILEISGENKVSRVIFENGESLDTAGVFIAIGTAGSTDLARKIGAETDGNKIFVDKNMSTNLPGLYAAGDCTGGLLQVSKAVADGAAAAMSMISFLK